jgi:hypothetical protein
MATTAAIAALRATALGNCGVGSIKNVGDNCPRCPCHCPTLSAATSLPTPLPVLLQSPSHLSVCDEEGNGKGNKSNDNCDEEGDGDGGKSNGNSNKEGDDKAG